MNLTSGLRPWRTEVSQFLILVAHSKMVWGQNFSTNDHVQWREFKQERVWNYQEELKVLKTKTTVAHVPMRWKESTVIKYLHVAVFLIDRSYVRAVPACGLFFKNISLSRSQSGCRCCSSTCLDFKTLTQFFIFVNVPLCPRLVEILKYEFVKHEI